MDFLVLDTSPSLYRKTAIASLVPPYFLGPYSSVRAIGATLVSNHAGSLLAQHMQAPLSFHIDNQHSFTAASLQLRTYWAEPSLAIEGTINGRFVSSTKYDDDDDDDDDDDKRQQQQDQKKEVHGN